MLKIQLVKNHDRILVWVSLWSMMDLFPIQLMIIIYLFYNMSFFIRSSCVSSYVLNFVKLTLIVILDASFNSQWHRKEKIRFKNWRKIIFSSKKTSEFSRGIKINIKRTADDKLRVSRSKFYFLQSYSYESSTILFILLKSWIFFWLQGGTQWLIVPNFYVRKKKFRISSLSKTINIIISSNSLKSNSELHITILW